MKNLTFSVSCKSCLKTDGLGRLSIIQEPYTHFITDRQLEPDYKIGQFIRESLISQGENCQFCGSKNLDIGEIVFGGINSLPGNEVDQLQLVMDKDGDNIELRTGGSQYLPNGFYSEAFQLIEKHLATIPEREFEEKQMGMVRIVVSTGYIGHDDYRTTRIEQFKFAGFRKSKVVEIIEAIKPQLVD